MIDGLNEKELREMTERTEKKIARLLKEYPCIVFPCNQEICFNEEYINEMGYSLETFTTTILQEGIPR